jgi:hypothetical protein
MSILGPLVLVFLPILQLVCKSNKEYRLPRMIYAVLLIEKIASILLASLRISLRIEMLLE